MATVTTTWRTLAAAAVCLALACSAEPPPSTDGYRTDCTSNADCVAVTPSKTCPGECSGCGPSGAVNTADRQRWEDDEAARSCGMAAPLMMADQCNCSTVAMEAGCVGGRCTLVQRP